MNELINTKMNFEHDIQHCVQILQQGGIILYPTDTVWGLGCDATNAEAVAKIYTIKQRNDSKAMIVLVAEKGEVLQYTEGIDLSLFDYLEGIKSPTTVIYKKGIGFAENLTAADGSIAIRICNDEFCKTLIKQFGKPIVSSSANISDHLAPKNFKEINAYIKSAVDYIVKFRQEDETSYQPSAIIKWKNGKIERIR
jgi:L-threonylcarbamoyladenylate synthase